MKLATEWVTPREIAKTISEEIGEDIEVKEVDEAKWQTLRTKEYEEIWRTLQTYYTSGPDYRDVELTNKLLPSAKTVKDLIRSWGKSIVQERNLEQLNLLLSSSE
jgi:flavodoxin